MPLRLMTLRTLSAFACTGLLLGVCLPLSAQMDGAPAGSMPGQMAAAKPPAAPMPSPPATADASLAGGTLHIDYHTPHLRGRHLGGPEIVPYGQVWRTGANPATTLITSVPLKFGTLLVPAGTHTLYTLPGATAWQLILNNQTGQWGTVYQQGMDLGRVPMKSKPMSAPQEVMSLSFENTSANSTELHIRWDTTDEFVTITKP